MKFIIYLCPLKLLKIIMNERNRIKLRKYLNDLLCNIGDLNFNNLIAQLPENELCD